MFYKASSDAFDILLGAAVFYWAYAAASNMAKKKIEHNWKYSDAKIFTFSYLLCFPGCAVLPIILFFIRIWTGKTFNEAFTFSLTAYIVLLVSALFGVAKIHNDEIKEEEAEKTFKEKERRPTTP